MGKEDEGIAPDGTASRQTLEHARAIGRQIKQSLESRHGFRVGVTVRSWSADTIEELRRLPRSSAVLGITVLEGGPASEAAAYVTGYGAEVAHVGEHVIVLEVAAAEEDGRG